ncbi:MAG: hypothetical protein JXR78_18725 [Victivallales bacterium]|nr:hypothetical protein [Victivallales bacterium]
MCSLRVSDLSLISTMQSSVTNNRDAYSKIMLQLSTGQKYLTRSENVSETQEASLLSISASKYNQWVTNLNQAKTWEQITDSSNQQVLDIMQQMSALLVEANTQINSPSDLATIATEINEIIESLVDLGNTTYSGVNLYAGTGTCSETFSVTYDVDGNIDTVTYNGSGTQRSISTAETSTISYGTLGSSMFDFQYTDKDGNVKNVDVFASLISLRDDLSNGIVNSDTLKDLEAAVDNTIACTVRTTSSQNRIDNSISGLKSLSQVTSNTVSDLLNVDEAEAITEFYAVEASLQAALEMVGRVNQMSIVNYIK